MILKQISPLTLQKCPCAYNDIVPPKIFVKLIMKLFLSFTRIEAAVNIRHIYYLTQTIEFVNKIKKLQPEMIVTF